MSAGIGLCVLTALLVAFSPRRWPRALAWIGGPFVVASMTFLLQMRVASDTRRPPTLACVLTSLAMGMAAAALPRRHRARGAAVAAVGLVVLACADVLHLRALGSILPLTTPGVLRQAGGAAGSIPALFRARDVVFAVALMGALAVRRLPPSRGGWPWIVPAFLMMGWALHSTRARQMVSSPVGDGFVTLHALELAHVLERMDRRWHRDDALAQARIALDRRVPDDAAPMAWRRPGASVLMIQLESVNAWAVGLEVGGQPVTPVLDAMAKESLVFTNVISQVSRGRSSDADLLVHASLHPLREGIAAFDVDPTTLATLPRTLRMHGYRTLSAVADSPGFWNSRARHEGYGFETSLFEDEIGTGPTIGFGLADDVMFERVAPRIAALPRPFLAWLITLSAHHPFRPLPPAQRSLPMGDLSGTPLGNYLEIVHYDDASLGSLLGTLTALGALENTIVAIYADHDEQNFRDPDRLQSLAASRAPGHPDPRRRIPLLVHLPGAPASARIDTPGGLIDLAPTLLALLEVERPRAFLGHSRLSGDTTAVRRHDGLSMSSEGWVWGERCTLTTDCDEARAAGEREILLSETLGLLGLGPAFGTVPVPVRAMH